MESFYNPPVIWMVAGFIFFLLEFAIPGFILFFFAIGAWIVALLSLFFEMSINTQLIIFLAGSLLTILFFRNWVKKMIGAKKNSTELEDEFVCKRGIAETVIAPGYDGKVNFKGTSWTARSSETIDEGENVVIVGNESIVLIVKSTRNLSL